MLCTAGPTILKRKKARRIIRRAFFLLLKAASSSQIEVTSSKILFKQLTIVA